MLFEQETPFDSVPYCDEISALEPYTVTRRKLGGSGIGSRSMDEGEVRLLGLSTVSPATFIYYDSQGIQELSDNRLSCCHGWQIQFSLETGVAPPEVPR